MALRALGNTLPAAVAERPKKSAKLSTPAAAPVEGGKKRKNDENAAPRAKSTSPTAAAAEQAVEYVRSEDLQPVAAPKARAAVLVADLDSKDRVKVCEALNDARRLAIHHPALLTPILYVQFCLLLPDLTRGREKLVLAVVKTMKNPRSAVLKTSVMASTDVFSTIGNLISSSSAEAFDKLLLKASQDKRFVCEEVEKAMRAMATSMSSLPLLKKLKSYVHHANLRVRAKAAVAMSHCAARMDIETMKEFGLLALLQVSAELLNDRGRHRQGAGAGEIGGGRGLGEPLLAEPVAHLGAGRRQDRLLPLLSRTSASTPSP